MKLITHNGKFHTDEVFGAALLTYLIPDLEIIRTRDKKAISDAIEDFNSIVIDVGKVYNPNKDAFDHHQESFNVNYFGTRGGINMSSCGLVWKHFSWEIVEKMLQECFSKKIVITTAQEDLDNDSSLGENDLGEYDTYDIPDIDYTKVINRFYNEVVLHIDANDNGVKHIKNLDSVRYNYRNLVTLENVIGGYNGKNVGDDKEQLVRFKQAMKVCGEFFFNKLHSILRNEIEYSKHVCEFEEIFNGSIGEWLYIGNDQLNYSMYINGFDPEKRIKFIIVKKKGEYRIHTRRVRSGDFDIVAKIIKEDDAKKLVGDQEVVFVHRAQFVGACKTLEAAGVVCEASVRQYWGWMLPFRQAMEYWGLWER